jgi:hypothetical protein
MRRAASMFEKPATMSSGRAVSSQVSTTGMPAALRRRRVVAVCCTPVRTIASGCRPRKVATSVSSSSAEYPELPSSSS